MASAIAFPPPSILIEPEAIVDACEMAEMSPPPPPPTGEKEAGLRFVEVAELAALLHLGEYVHARHLWRRHRPDPSDPSTRDGGAAAAAEDSSSDPELRQLALLWTSAARPMIADDPAAAYAGLDRCASSGLSPLATYAAEVRRSYRERCARRAARAYERMRDGSCRDWFGYNGEGEAERMAEELRGRGWREEAGEGGEKFWIPPPPGWEPEEEGEEDGMDAVEDAKAADDYDSRIKSLTEIVSFMERKRLNA